MKALLLVAVLSVPSEAPARPDAWLDEAQAEIGTQSFEELKSQALKGKALLFGLAGVRQDKAAAEALLRKAVRSGEACGVCELWWLGGYFPKDRALAFRCFENGKDYFWLSYMRGVGMGTKKDPLKSIADAKACVAGGDCPDDRIIDAAEGRPGSYYGDSKHHISPYWWTADDTMSSIYAVSYERITAKMVRRLRWIGFRDSRLDGDDGGLLEALYDAYSTMHKVEINLKLNLNGETGSIGSQISVSMKLAADEAYSAVLERLEAFQPGSGDKAAFEKADQRLNEAYRSAKYFVGSREGELVEAQRAWIRFRDLSTQIASRAAKADTVLAQNIAWQMGEALSLERAGQLDALLDPESYY